MPESHRHSPEPGFKASAHGPGPTDFTPLVGSQWERGNTLVAKLKQGQVGRFVDFRGGRGAAQADMEAAPLLAKSTLPTDAECRSLGTFVRVPA